MKAVVLWTVNDFPAYGNLSGWSTKGYLACPVCNADACSYKLRRKIGYLASRRWLRKNHPWRKQKELFNNEEEKRSVPKNLSSEDILRQVNTLRPSKPGKHKDNPDLKRKRMESELNWTKKSIFFELEYWSKLKIRHNLDVMQIEKNICDNIVGTLLCMDKSKDTVKARLDLEDMGIREELHLERHGTQVKKHLAHYSLSSPECKCFCHFIKNQKFPDGLASNISRCVKNGKISGLKTHDCQVLLQRLLPVGIRPYLSKEVCDAIIGLSSFFEQICAKTLNVEDLDRLQQEIVVILCKLEQIFPPAFFTVMVHLAVHLPLEAKLAGPVMYRWMYPIERRLGDLKRYVRNRAHLEGSIAEGYIAEESLMFCSLHLHDIETVHSRPESNYDAEEPDAQLSVFAQNVRACGGRKMRKWSESELEPAKWYILDNCVEVEPYKIKHRTILERESHLNLDERQRKSFPQWFKNHIKELYIERSDDVTKELYVLSHGLYARVATYTICMLNGVKWHVKQIENNRSVQNSGIMVPGSHGQRESNFYGQLVSIVEIRYAQGYSVFLFKATQTQQVFYFDDPKLGSRWKVIQKIRHRHVWDVPENEDDHDMETKYVDEEDQVEDFVELIEDENVNPGRALHRDNVEPEIHVLSDKDLEQSSSHDVDFIDDDPEDEEMLSADEENTENNEDDYDSDLD
ncbi:hypothetical protein ACLB2K_013740 [Fragaria x ananassa]